MGWGMGLRCIRNGMGLRCIRNGMGLRCIRNGMGLRCIRNGMGLRCPSGMGFCVHLLIQSFCRDCTRLERPDGEQTSLCELFVSSPQYGSLVLGGGCVLKL